jgi:MFS family permease
MDAIQQPIRHQTHRPQRSATIIALYVVEAMCSIAGTLLSIGTAFYMKNRFAWDMRENFMLVAGQGIFYVPGALIAGWVTRRLGRGAAIVAAYAVLTVLSLLAWHLARAEGNSFAVALTLLVYTFVIGISWPIMESLIASGDANGLARRLAAYNIVWPLAGAAAIAIEGTVITYWTAGVFLIPAAMHLIALVLMLPWMWAADAPSESGPAAPVRPEPQLLHKRTLALWLSRAALPATYAVIYGLMPLMPFLSTIRPLDTAKQTAVASVWLWARLLSFIVLALGSWWHTRPRILLWAAVVMLAAFFGMTLPPTHGRSPAIDLASMILWQIVLGGALGMIYSASLYFGMVLSEGSTEHGGYHEALIGLGWVIGPVAGVLAQQLRPGEVWAGVAAVGAVITLSVLIVLAIAVLMGRADATIEGGAKLE